MINQVLNCPPPKKKLRQIRLCLLVFSKSPFHLWILQNLQWNREVSYYPYLAEEGE